MMTEKLKKSINWEKEAEKFDSIQVTDKLANDIEKKVNAEESKNQRLVKGKIIELK